MRMTWKAHCFALIGYTVIAILITWPLVLHLPAMVPALPGEIGRDVWQNMWDLWWAKHALLVEHTNPYYTDMLFYPLGASLYLHTLNLPTGILAMPLLALFGIVTAYNLITLAVLVLVAYTSFLAVNAIVDHAPAAFVAGAITICSPHRLNELRLAQLPTLSDYFFPLVLLFTLMALRHRTWRAAIGAAGTLMLVGLCSWYHILHAAVLLLPILIWRSAAAFRSARLAGLRAELIPWLKIAALSLVLALPFVIPVVGESISSPTARKSDDLIFHSDLLDLVPMTFGRIWPTDPAFQVNPHIFAALPLILALIGLALTRRKAIMWAAIAAFGFVLSLGPSLHVNGADTGVMLPYALLRAIPVLDVLRAPARINFVTTLMIAIVAAYGLAAIAQRFSAKAAWAGSVLLIALIAGESIRLPFPLIDAAVHPVYAQLAAEPGEWSVIEFPLDQFDGAQFQMYAQIYHEHHILTGHLARDVPSVPYESAPPIAQVELGAQQLDIVGMPSQAREQLLRGLRVRYIIMHTDPAHPERARQQAATAQAALGPLSQIFGDAAIHVYRLDSIASWLDGEGKNATVEMPLFLGLDGRWGAIEPRGDALNRWLPAQGAGFWTFAERPRRATLNLNLFSFAGERPLEIWLNGRQIETISIAPGSETRVYHIQPFTLPRGPSTIELRAPAGGVSPKQLGINNDARLLSFGIRHAEIVELIK